MFRLCFSCSCSASPASFLTLSSIPLVIFPFWYSLSSSCYNLQTVFAFFPVPFLLSSCHLHLRFFTQPSSASFTKHCIVCASSPFESSRNPVNTRTNEFLFFVRALLARNATISFPPKQLLPQTIDSQIIRILIRLLRNLNELHERDIRPAGSAINQPFASLFS